MFFLRRPAKGRLSTLGFDFFFDLDPFLVGFLPPVFFFEGFFRLRFAPPPAPVQHEALAAHP